MVTDTKENMCGYIATYKDKRLEVYAQTSFEAQLKAAKIFKAKKTFEVNVYLCELEGKEVTQAATF